MSACTMPQATYRKVDQSTPAFKQAVTAETERQKALGESASSAQEIATKVVTRQVIQEQKTKRKAEVVPLVEILEAYEKPRGCWAYTATTTSRHDNLVSVRVEHYDPFQPEERLWTLVSRDGQVPDEEAQAAYRKRRLREWKKTDVRADPKRAKSQQTKRNALYADLEITHTPVDENEQTTYTFNRGRITVPLLGDIPPSRETYVAREGTLLGQTNTYFGPASLLAGTIAIAHFDSRADYAVIDPSVAPFVVKTIVHYRASIFGTDTGEVERETVYTDYRRVKCYEERFETRIGAPSMIDFVPEASGR